MLTLPEEIILLAIDENSGEIMQLPERSLDFALAGSILTELALLGRITYDDFFITSISRESTNNKILDEALSYLPDSKNLTVQSSIARIAKKGDKWEDKILSSLVLRSVVAKKKRGLFEFSSGAAYDLLKPEILKDIENRIRSAVESSSEKLPDRDIVLISIMSACNLWNVIFSEDELAKYQSKIDSIVDSHIIARSVAHSISEIQNAILEVIAFSGL